MQWKFSIGFGIVFYAISLNAKDFRNAKYGDTVEMDCFEPDLANQDSQSYISLHVAMPNVKANAIVQYRPARKQYLWIKSAFENNITILSTGKAQIKMYFMTNATISCEFHSFSLDSPTKSAKFVIVITPKTKVKALKQNFNVGSKLENVAECVVYDGNPNPEVNWIPVNHDLKFSQNKVVSSSSGLVTVTDVLQIQFSKSYHGKTFQCKASHPGLATPFRSDVKLNVIYPPGTPEIRFDYTKSTLTCVSDGNPPPTYEWTIPSSANPIGSQSINVDSSKRNEVYSCIAMNSAGKSDKKTITLKDLLAGSTSVVVASVLTVIVLFALLGAAYVIRKRRIQPLNNTDKAPEIENLFHYDGKIGSKKYYEYK